MDVSKASSGYNITIKSEPTTDEQSERYEDSLHLQNSDILLPGSEKQTFQYLMSDFDQFERLKLEPLYIKSEAIESETEISNKSFPHIENMCFGSISNVEEFSNKNTRLASLDTKSEHDSDENDFLLCAEILNASSFDVEDTNNKSKRLSDVGQSSKLLEIQEEPIDLSYTGLDISYPDIKKECSEYSAKAKDVHNKVIQCPECTYTCSHASKLKYHAVTHSGENAFTCGHCDRLFRRKNGLRKHIFTHSGQKPFKCSQCKRAFGRKDSLKKHMHTHSVKKLITCSECKITFNRKEDHKKHVIGHDRESLYARFKNNLPDYLKNLRAHNDAMPFKCPLCSFCSYKKGDLNLHVWNHNGDKSFCCQQCNFSCNLKSNLIRHILTHAKKPLIYSSKQFSFVRARRSNPEPHTLNQRAIPQYTFSFPQSGNLNGPNFTGGENKPFKCSQCSFTCFSKCMLGLHELSLGAH